MPLLAVPARLAVHLYCLVVGGGMPGSPLALSKGLGLWLWYLSPQALGGLEGPEPTGPSRPGRPREAQSGPHHRDQLQL